MFLIYKYLKKIYKLIDSCRGSYTDTDKQATELTGIVEQLSAGVSS